MNQSKNYILIFLLFLGTLSQQIIAKSSLTIINHRRGDLREVTVDLEPQPGINCGAGTRCFSSYKPGNRPSEFQYMKNDATKTATWDFYSPTVLSITDAGGYRWPDLGIRCTADGSEEIPYQFESETIARTIMKMSGKIKKTCKTISHTAQEIKDHPEMEKDISITIELLPEKFEEQKPFGFPF